jgi:hypothetical protein
MAQTRRTRAKAAEPEHDRVCPVGFCPVGMFLSVTGNARPEAVDHLVAAGREFVQALAAVLNTRADEVGRSPSIEKIEIE